ncbi:MAG: glycoside hydrolase family 13 protein, partial [Ruminococcaceae bacterium]|nr:glycoside hydrolase family 13 protein [Oscillospiraceae bacterium]
MLPKLHQEIEKRSAPVIQRSVDTWDVSRRGAFPLGTVLRFSVHLPRRLGVSAVVMRLWRDGEEARDLPLAFSSSACGVDDYTLTLKLDASLCGGEDGLLYYEILFLRGGETLFTNSINNVDFFLGDSPSTPFRLLVYRADFCVPAWFAGGTMYHVFVDRFCRGQESPHVRSDAIFNDDWENGVPQYPEQSGDDFSNNEFFGGDLTGIVQKLDYLVSLGVTVLYLSPIFKAYSNHKYDTGDYEKVDEAFGGNEALLRLIEAARKKGIRILLDGVFNHTGDDSRYFNRYGKYESLGAYESKDSPYFPWYIFREHPHSYESWWGIRILPKLNPACKACRDYFVGEDGIIARYLKMGIGGWRLDVADELSDEFLDELRSVAKKTDGDAFIIGEVWENAADKVAYGKRRRYFRGTQLDSVMNYPLKNAILAFVLEGDAECFYNTVTELYSSYPPFVCDALMNLLGTHDTARILSVLGNAPLDRMSNADLATYRFSG